MPWASIWLVKRQRRITDAMDHALAEIGEAKDAIVSAAAEHTLARSEW